MCSNPCWRSHCLWLAFGWQHYTAGWGPPRWLRDASNFEFAPNTWFTAGILAFTLAFLRFAIPSGFQLGDMFGALGGGRWEAPWSRGDLGGLDAILDHFSYFGFLLPVLTVMLSPRMRLDGCADNYPNAPGGDHSPVYRAGRRAAYYWSIVRKRGGILVSEPNASSRKSVFPPCSSRELFSSCLLSLCSTTEMWVGGRISTQMCAPRSRR